MVVKGPLISTQEPHIVSLRSAVHRDAPPQLGMLNLLRNLTVSCHGGIYLPPDRRRGTGATTVLSIRLSIGWRCIVSKLKQPFYHEDISVLAKSLKSQLTTLGKSPGHVELLNMLARTTGHQNYQSWTSMAGDEEMVEGSIRLEFMRLAMEVFQRDSTGRIIDRRHEDVERVFVLMDLNIWIGNVSHTGTIRVRASVNSSLLEEHQEPENWLKPYVPKALQEWIEREPATTSIFGTLDLSLDRYVENKVFMRFPETGRIECKIHLPLSHAKRLQYECQQAKKAIAKFEKAKQILWDIFSQMTPQGAVRQQREQVSNLTGYLRDYLEIEGEMFMSSWNQEKLGQIIDYLEQALKKPSSVNDNEWKQLAAVVYGANAPNHWLKPVNRLDNYAF
jgi:hypothetical protein